MLALIASLVLGLLLPLTVVMILWVNLITDGVCDIPLGLEPNTRDVLRVVAVSVTVLLVDEGIKLVRRIRGQLVCKAGDAE